MPQPQCPAQVALQMELLKTRSLDRVLGLLRKSSEVGRCLSSFFGREALNSYCNFSSFKQALSSTQLDLTYSSVSALYKAQDASFSFGKVFQKKSL